jgi:tRNA 2-thiocytidine biosynthesis protein TtcA
MAQTFPYFDKETSKVFSQISRLCGRAIVDYDMIREGDRVLIGVSGGKDSLTLLNVMLHRQKIAPVDFEVAAVHVDNGLPAADIPKLKKYLVSLGIPFHIIKAKLFKDDEPQDLNCFWCSWTRRKAMFQYAQKNGFAKVALAHHMDDIVETALLNQFFKGEVSAMNPRQEMFGGKVVIIRPLCYEREETIVRFTKSANLASFETCRCPVSATTQRSAMKKFLKDMEKVSPAAVQNVFNSLKNIKEDYLP